MTARIAAAAELMVRAMLGQDGTPAAIVQALADANLLQPEERPAEIACQADLVAALRDLTAERAARAELEATVEHAEALLASYRRLVPRLQEQGEARDRVIQQYEQQVTGLLDLTERLQAASGRPGGAR